MTLAILDALASPMNYRGGRASPIDMIVMHVMEGTELSARNWFRHPEAQASAHYGVTALGQILRYVDEDDTAWHAGNPEYNARSVAIELEGWSSSQSWFAAHPGGELWVPSETFTPALLNAAAQLAQDIATRRGIPVDRAHIIGHAEVPDPRRPGLFGGAHNHTDPGSSFPWDAFMAAVAGTCEV